MKKTTIQKIKNCFKSIDDEEIEYFVIATGSNDENCIGMHGGKEIERIFTGLMIEVPPFKNFILRVMENYMAALRTKEEKENKDECNNLS